MNAAKRFAFAIGALALLLPTTALAGPSVWSRALDPEADQRATLLEQANALLLKPRHLRRGQVPTDLLGVADLYLREALKILERAGGESSPNIEVRFRYGEVLSDLHDSPGCVRAFESLLKANPPPPIRAEAFSRVAICYAHLNRRTEEIRAYDGALELEAYNLHRARLLSNRAEAEMALGNLDAAVAGYRESLSLLQTPREMFYFAPTTFWGLAVALDRSSELDAALESIQLARSYDPSDSKITGPDWFYSPDYDESWYMALGHWSLARNATLAATRNDHYASAVEAWEEYILRAPPDDQYLPLAKARFKTCEEEWRGRKKQPGGALPLAKPANKSRSP